MSRRQPRPEASGRMTALGVNLEWIEAAVAAQAPLRRVVVLQ